MLRLHRTARAVRITGARPWRLLRSAGVVVGGILVLSTCGARPLTDAAPTARVVSLCALPGESRLVCDDGRVTPAALQRAARDTFAGDVERRAVSRLRPKIGPDVTLAQTAPLASEAEPPTTVTTAPPPPPPTEPPPPPAEPEAAAEPEPEPEEEAPPTTAKRKKATATTPPAPAPEPEPTAPPATDPPEDTTAPPPPPPAPRVDTGVGGRVVSLVNAQRAAAGLGPVSSNGALTSAAARHSKDQAAMDKMSHTGSDGSSMSQRCSAAGYGWRALGENVAAGYGSADSVMNGWMNSPGHRNNIMNPTFVHIGVAVAYAADGTAYWTMDLGAPA